MSDQNTDFYSMLEKIGFTRMEDNPDYCPLGKCYGIPEKAGKGLFWIYIEKGLFDIKIQDFMFHKDELFDSQMLNWPESLSIVYCQSVSGEEFMPYRRLTAGSIKTFLGGKSPYKALYHGKVPIRTISIEIMPQYYEKYLKEAFPDEYINPHDAFRAIDLTSDFPEMVTLLNQIWSYKGDGMAAKLFFRSKVSEAVALVIEHNKKLPNEEIRISDEDLKALQNIGQYINDHCSRTILLEKLARIACMGTTKLKSTFKQVYGCTISEYIQQRRLSQGENFLTSTDFTIEQIAKAVGYSNAGRFSKDFRNSTGLNPSEYRRMTQKK